MDHLQNSMIFPVFSIIPRYSVEVLSVAFIILLPLLSLEDIMEPREVWVKLRESTKDPFKVQINQPNADIDDLKDAIKAEKNVKVEFIYTEDGQGENSKCRPGAPILSHDGPGSNYEQPYYYTISPPASGKN